jgi:hypothetical protein
LGFIAVYFTDLVPEGTRKRGVTIDNPEQRSERRSGIRGWFGRLSLTRQILAGVLALAAAIGTIAGAVQATANLLEWWSQRTAEPSLVRSPWLGLEVWQDGSRNPVLVENERTVKVPMSRKDFELRIPIQEESFLILICAWTDNSVFLNSQGGDIYKVGGSCVAPGHGMASSPFGEATLVLGNKASNVFCYAKVDRELCPLNAPTVDGQVNLYVGWVSPGPSHAFKGGSPPSIQKKTPLTELDKDIFLTVFTDRNPRNWRDRPAVKNYEYEYVVLDF